MSAMTWAPQPAMGPLREEQCPIGIRTAHRTSDDDSGGVYCNHLQNERIFGFHETRNSVSVFARIPQKMHRIEGKNLPNLCSNKPDRKLSSLFSMHCLVRVPGYSSCQDEPLIWKIVEIFFGKYFDKQFIKGKVQQCYC